MAAFNFIDRGIEDYKKCWDYQEELHASIVASKGSFGKPSPENYFILVEHPHVYTLGKSGDESNLLIRSDFLEKIGATYYRINRGGDITYHGPGQIVGYPVIDLEFYGLGVKEFIRKMEAAVSDTMAEFGISCGSREGATGVWTFASTPSHSRKICAIGVRVSRYVTMHGFALNINTDLRYFGYINPCGFASSAVTSMEQELGHPVSIKEVKEVLMQKFNQKY
jgi:lipoyl(octanoyl) transferase